MSINSPVLSGISFVISLLSIGIVSYSYRLNQKSFQTTIFSRLLEQVGNKEARDNRRIVRFPEHKTKTEWEEAAYYTAVMCDRIGLLLEHDAKLEKKFLKTNADWIVDVWAKIDSQDLIAKRRRENSPKYVFYFDGLAKRAIEALSKQDLEVLKNSLNELKQENDILDIAKIKKSLENLEQMQAKRVKIFHPTMITEPTKRSTRRLENYF